MITIRTLLLIELLVDRTNAEPVLPTNIFNSEVGTNVALRAVGSPTPRW